MPVRPMLTRLLIVAVAGVATGLGFEPLALAYLVSLAVAAVTLACRGVRLRAGFGLGFVYGTAFMLTLLPWLQVVSGYVWVLLAVAEGLYYGLMGLTVAAVVRLRFWPVWVACSWVFVELLRGAVPFGGFPWGRLAFATTDTPVAPLMTYLGTGGVTFVVALVGTTLAWAAVEVRRTPQRAAGGVVAVSLLAVAAAPGHVNAASSAPGLRRVTVAAVQGNVPGIGLHAFARQRAVLNDHVTATMRFARRVDRGQVRRPDLVVWPENSSDIDPYTDVLANAAIARAARAVHAPLLMGAVIGGQARHGWRNRAIVWSKQGVPGAYYDKTHPVPFGEYIPLRSLLAHRVAALHQIPADMIPGRRPGLLQVGPAKVGVLMCFEVAYDGLLRNLVNGGAQAIVVPTNNATYTGTGQVEQQFAMSRLRAIETGRYVVVASTNGVSGVIAPDGSVVKRAPERVQDVLESSVALTTRVTPAIRFGALLERSLAFAGLLALVCGILVGRRRSGNLPDTPSVERQADPVTTGSA
ncbi:MAG: apolipoprotein N-acyltransferase [Nocardioidaceae bacterium]